MSNLRKLAKAATPGPWHSGYWDGEWHIESPDVLIVQEVERVPDKAQAGANADYIAAANHTEILALLDERDALRTANSDRCREIEELRRKLQVIQINLDEARG